MIELHHWEPTAESLKLLIALNEKSLPFQSRYVDVLKLEHHGETYRAAAGGEPGRVPLLVDGGERMQDSQFALEYLAEAYDPRLAPTDPAGWYDVQAWTAQLDQGLSAHVRLLGWHTVTLPGMAEAERSAFRERAAGAAGQKAEAGWAQVTSDAEASEDQLALARDRIAGMIETVEAALKHADWLVGGAYSIADIDGFALTHSLPRLTPELVNAEKTPRMMDWLRRIGARDAVKISLKGGRSAVADAYAPAV